MIQEQKLISRAELALILYIQLNKCLTSGRELSPLKQN